MKVENTWVKRSIQGWGGKMRKMKGYGHTHIQSCMKRKKVHGDNTLYSQIKLTKELAGLYLAGCISLLLIAMAENSDSYVM